MLNQNFVCSKYYKINSSLYLEKSKFSTCTPTCRIKVVNYLLITTINSTDFATLLLRFPRCHYLSAFNAVPIFWRIFVDFG